MKRDDFEEKYSKETYIGDGVFVHFDGYHIMLRTPREDGNHVIGLEPSVWENLELYKKTLYGDIKTIED